MIEELKRVLLVEDDSHDVELTLEALGDRLANEVVVTRDGAEAWDYLTCSGRWAERAPGSPAVVLLDLKLPKMDGLEVLRRMRAMDSLHSIPVVMLTSSREERDVVQSYQLGVNAYVVKPVAFEDFMSAIKNLGLFWAVLNQPPPSDLRRAA